tara:strand:+ start:160 stop:492 length:333 start_codon:yes stop_codon:yes gene_type:complete
MAAVDLSTASISPWVSRTASVGTTWQAFTLPDWARAVCVTPNGTVRVAFDKAGKAGDIESPADGGAVGDHYQTVAANASFEFTRIGSLRAGSLYVAADTGTVDVSVVVMA